MKDLEKLRHYSLTNPASIYDEEALTALELAGRTAAKVNEILGHVEEQDEKIQSLFDTELRKWVYEWLDLHPEATTTVQDGSLDTSKFTDETKAQVIKDYDTPEMYGAKGDGVTDDTEAIQSCLTQSDNVKLVGTYLVKDEITVKSGQTVDFEGGKLIASNDFAGETVLRVINSGSDGKLSNVTIDGKQNQIHALIVDYCQHLTIDNFYSIRCYNGGIQVNGGYECLVKGFNIIYDVPEHIPSQPLEKICGIKLLTSDCEVMQGNCVNYPIGCYTQSGNRLMSVHCWGMPHAEGLLYNGGFMMYGFVCTSSSNTLIGCCADTPALFDLGADPSVLNGGIGFLDAGEAFLSGVWAQNNNYIGCMVLAHNQSPAGSVIGFHIGDETKVSSTNTSIIAASFTGSTSALKEKIAIVNNKLIDNCTILTSQAGDRSFTKLGWIDKVRTNEQVFARSDYTGINTPDNVATTTKQYLKSTPDSEVLVAENVAWVHVDKLFIGAAVNNITTASPGKIELTGNETYTRGLTENTNFKIGELVWYNGTANLYLKRVGDNYYLTQDGDGSGTFWLVLETTSSTLTN